MSLYWRIVMQNGQGDLCYDLLPFGPYTPGLQLMRMTRDKVFSSVRVRRFSIAWLACRLGLFSVENAKLSTVRSSNYRTALADNPVALILRVRSAAISLSCLCRGQKT